MSLLYRHHSLPLCWLCLYSGCQGGSMCVCVWRNSILCQSVTAYIRFTSVCSVAVQKYGRNLRTERLTERIQRATPERQTETENQTYIYYTNTFSKKKNPNVYITIFYFIVLV